MLEDLIEKYVEQNEMYHFEGETGVKNLAKLARAIGYKDPMNFGQFETNACYGDLIEFLSDNPGAIEAVMNWIQSKNIPEWEDNLKEQLIDENEDEDEDEE